MSIWSPLPESLRQRLEHYVQRAAQLPRSVQKTVAVLTFLTVTLLFIGGGSLVIASLMHVVVTKLDMPPTLSGPIYITGNSVRAPSGSGVVIHVDKPGGGAQTTYIVVPRPTVAHALDHDLLRVRDPAGPFIQMDAVDLGLFLQQTVHDWLLGVFSDATRRFSPAEPAIAVPLTDGQ